jgi:predicted TIM-barrel fold metal-dependent hydrolase
MVAQLRRGGIYENRREFLQMTAGAAGVGLVSKPLTSMASQKEPASGKIKGKSIAGLPERIDVHHHIIPAEYVKALADRGIKASLGVKFPPWSLEKDLEVMDLTNVQGAILSISSPGAAVAGNVKASRSIARICNDIQAKLVNDYPQRYGAFATVGLLSDVEGTLKEIEYALDTLKFDGVELLTNYEGKYLGDGSFEEIYKELNRRKAVVHIHPSNPVHANPFPCTYSLMEAPFETTRAVTNLICGGTLERYPAISIILSHGGGTIPFLTNRIGLGVSANLWPNAMENVPKGFYYHVKQLYYDTAIVGSYGLPALNELAGATHILYGSDWAFAPVDVIEECIKDFEAYQGFDAVARSAIDRKNALVLFPKFGRNG